MENDENNLSSRLRFALKILDVSQTELAKKISVKPQIIQYLCSGKSERSKFTFNIAEALNIDVSWLAIGEGIEPSIKCKELSSPHNSIPVLSFKQIKESKINNNIIDQAKISDWIVSNDTNHNNLYGAILNDTSMAPKFDIETIVIIDPINNYEMQKLNNVFVLAYIAQENCILFRQLIMNRGSTNLTPINHTLFKTIPLSKDDVILGVCKEARWTA